VGSGKWAVYVEAKRGTGALDNQATAIAQAAIGGIDAQEMVDVMDRIMQRYGRSGSGRASALRLIGAYVILQLEGPPGLRRRGLSRMSIQLYRDKLADAGVRVP
jgi:hypothetical protein